MFTQIKKWATTLIVGLAISFTSIQSTFAITDKEAYESATICAALFKASANVLASEADRSSYNILVENGEKMTQAAIVFASSEAQARQDINQMTKVIDNMSDTEYTSLVDEIGDICVEIAVNL